MEIIFASIAGLIIGILIGVLISRISGQSLKTRLEVLQGRMDDLKSQSDQARAEAERHCREALEAKEVSCRELLAAKDASCRETLQAGEARHEEAMAALERRHREALEEMRHRFDETMQKVSAQMRSATDDMLRQRQKEFAESSTINLGQIVNPLKETMDEMRKTMDATRQSQTEISSDMKARLEEMMRQSNAARQSADELARVFSHRGKVQGDWGERALDWLLEKQGLTRGVHYDVQPVMRDAGGHVLKSDGGSSMRPDVILHLDTVRDVIIDSKVSLTAFINYLNAEDEETRRKALKEHVDSICRHVRELAAKDYSSYVQPPKLSMGYVIMFVPHSGALLAALNEKPDLWRDAMSDNVFIADEQTLFAALKIVDLTWRQIAQTRNHERVYALANEMMDRVGKFMKHYDAIGKALKTASDSYDEGRKKLDPSGYSILQTCRKLKNLGAQQSRTNPIAAIENPVPDGDEPEPDILAETSASSRLEVG